MRRLNRVAAHLANFGLFHRPFTTDGENNLAKYRWVGDRSTKLESKQYEPVEMADYRWVGQAKQHIEHTNIPHPLAHQGYNDSGLDIDDFYPKP